MIYRFLIISDEVDNFMREIQLDANATFLDFHRLIIKACGYEDNQLTSFTICERGWEKGDEITLEEMDSYTGRGNRIMADTELSEYLEDEKQHLLYTIDTLADRDFFKELAQKVHGKNQCHGTINAPERKMAHFVFYLGTMIWIDAQCSISLMFMTNEDSRCTDRTYGCRQD